MAEWMNEGLPSDPMSLENGTIITNCARWPLIIDPQLQGITWIRAHEEKEGGDRRLHVLNPAQPHWHRVLEQAIQNGDAVVLENIGEEVDAGLEPVLSRAVHKKGRNMFLMLGDEEISYDPAFKLYLQTRLSNPHYKPEIGRASCRERV